MDNQHRKINGYRELEEHEIDLINEIKDKGEELGILVEGVRSLLSVQQEFDSCSEQDIRWLNEAEMDLKKGIMGLVRSVAKPGTF